MGEWLKDRRNALIDAALIYVVTDWIAPPAVSAVIYLGLSDAGLLLLLSIAYLLLVATAFVVAIKMEPRERDTASEEGELVYVWNRPSVPFGLGGHGRWIRITPG